MIVFFFPLIIQDKKEPVGFQQKKSIKQGAGLLHIFGLQVSDSIKIRMNERGLNQKNLSELLGVSTSRISEYLNGKSEPTLKIARKISKKLDIDTAIVLGV
ncbi:helix-turn-helix domain-containing protein [Aquiflexum sp.]|uniref:helix-turn-helix domain-containing protein n=1 Tax=Aquiflexum sp. TaxID=1872584 RepID=UPI003593A625